MRIGSIVVGLDFTPASEAVLAEAVELGRGFGARLHLLHSYAVPMRGVMPYEFSVPDSIWDGIREVSEEKLAELSEKARAEGLEVSCEASAELPAEALVSAARAQQADLIVVGTHGHTGLKHALLGSVAEQTARIAPCSVWTVKTSAP